jgi:hypothetical protein
MTAELETRTHEFTPQQFIARNMLERASAALAYLAIVSTFGVVTLICCTILLVIWS